MATTATVHHPPVAVPAAARRKLTIDDLTFIHVARPEDRVELLDGEVFLTPAPRYVHSLVVSKLHLLIGNWAEEHGGDCVTAPTDVLLSLHDLVQPDVLYIAPDRLTITGGPVVAGPPDLVVEVLSPSTSDRDLNIKRAIYERAGVREYWIVDIDTGTITVLELVDGHYVELAMRGDRLVSRVLPGLDLDPAQVFQRVRDRG